MPIDTSSSDYPPSNEWTEWEKIAFGTQYAWVLEQEKMQSEQRERNREDRKKRMNKARLKLNQQAQAAPGTRKPSTLSSAGLGRPDPGAGGLGGGLGGTAPGGGLGADTVPTTGGGAAPASVAGETKGRKAPAPPVAVAATTSTSTYLLYGAIAVGAILLLRR